MQTYVRNREDKKFALSLIIVWNKNLNCSLLSKRENVAKAKIMET